MQNLIITLWEIKENVRNNPCPQSKIKPSAVCRAPESEKLDLRCIMPAELKHRPQQVRKAFLNK